MANMFKNIKDWSKKKKILAVVIAAAIVIAVCGISFAGCHKPQPIKASQRESAAVFDDNIRHYRDGKKAVKATAEATALPTASASASSETKPDDSKSEKSAESKDSGSQSNSQTPAKQPTSSVPIGNKPAAKSGSKSTSKSCKVVHHDATGHNEDITEQKWVQDSGAWDETVVDQDAWDEKVVDKPASQHTVLTYHCNNCPYTTQDMAAADNHMESTGHLAYYYDEQWVNDPEVSHTVHHDAVTHVVHHDATGHYETVVTGQKWVVDSGAWDETVCN
ncbi:MAG: hypothetical protein PUF17_07320 [Lactimicrobium massiliense]|nr:hypothetical protein [Lactimicrobium massiliense]MDD6560765.1 hypothetical protein [Lactimicrobium massiliense]